jgi:signal transduction histidine kinase
MTQTISGTFTASPPAIDPGLLATLRGVSLFARLDDEDQSCYEALKQGRELRFGPAERIASEGDPAALYVVLEGEFQVKRQLDGRAVFFPDGEARRVFGELPLLLGVPFFASFDAVTACRVFRLEEDAFWQMLSRCRSVTREVLRAMARRLKSVEALGQQQGQLTSLGSMAAGLAHELNNPAAAARRAAEALRTAVREAQDAACLLGRSALPDRARAFIVAFRSGLVQRAASPPKQDPVEQSDLEERIGEWLLDRGLPDPWEAASVLARAGFDEDSLAGVEREVPKELFPLVLRWAEHVLQTLFLLGDLEKSVARVGDVVRAVSSYSYMDQAPQQDVDLHAGLDDTLTIMTYRLRGVKVVREYDPAVPRLYAFGGELNQVWTNLIDNAVDAVEGVPGGGEIRIRTALEDGRVLVEIRDNGHGIPEAARERLFELFFTTKGVGKGTGIGLQTSRRIVVGRHAGDLQVQSQPGDTRFQVYLPLKPPGAGTVPPPAAVQRAEGGTGTDDGGRTEDGGRQTADDGRRTTDDGGQQASSVILRLPSSVRNPQSAIRNPQSADPLEALRTVPLLAPMIEEGGAIARVLEAGREVCLEPGEELGHEGDAPFFSVIVEGEVRVTKRIDGQELFVGTQGAGAFLGEIPLLLDLPFTGSVYATMPTRIYRFEPETFWQIVGVCPRSARLILRTYAERLQVLIGLALQQEKLAALGTLAAGLAHELNNPSAAARRAAAHLRSAVLSQQKFICQLGAADLTLEQREALKRLPKELASPQRPEAGLDPVSRSDREAALARRLEELGLADAWELAPALAAAWLDLAWIEKLRAALPGAAVPDVLRWVERTLTVERLLDEVENSTRRIAMLVKAVKSYSHAGEGKPEEADLHTGLDDALAVLSHKLAGVRVLREYAADLPRVPGYPGELAQVWVNLLDNAAAAVEGHGEVHIRTAREQGQVLVEIRDDGPGIPPGLERRIWEPFFTTRAIGEGMGLGLVTAHRIVAGRHHGDISVRSTPGDTRFQVRLPLQPPAHS